jgi:hypothetical protein
LSGRILQRRRLLRGAALLAGFLVLTAAGCFGSRRGDVPPPETGGAPMSDNAAAVVAIPPAIPIPEEPAPAVKPEAPAVPSERLSVPREPLFVPEANPQEAGKAAAAVSTDKPRTKVSLEPPPAEKSAPRGTQQTPPGKTAKVAAPPEPRASSAPVLQEGSPSIAWANRGEKQAYRVDFLGITMGYAQFRFVGKVSIGGRTAYHLNVRAWTSGILSYLYPINETIEYYLDHETIEPIRIEYTGRQNKRDDVAVYDQEKGRIVYRYRDSGEIRKQVDVVPGIHDPVSAAYYFRWRDMGDEGKSRNVYGGRKVYQISARLLGKERLNTDRGTVDTLVIQPVIRRDGKIEEKGDLKMWVSDDARHVPVRFYAKFRKIKEWTLVGELLPERTGG